MKRAKKPITEEQRIKRNANEKVKQFERYHADLPNSRAAKKKQYYRNKAKAGEKLIEAALILEDIELDYLD